MDANQKLHHAIVILVNAIHVHVAATLLAKTVQVIHAIAKSKIIKPKSLYLISALLLNLNIVYENHCF